MNRALRVVIITAVLLATVAFLFTVVFPWIDRQFLANPVLG